MGGSSSKVSQLNKSITDVTTEVVTKTSSSGSGSINAEQNLTFSGKVSNTKILQDAKLKLSILQDSTMNAKMQSEITNKIMAEVSKQKTDFPQITSSKSDTEITNIIENNVSSSFSQESIANISLEIKLKQNINFDKTALVDGVDIQQLGSAVGELINTMSGQIVSDLVSGTDLETKSTETTAFFGATLIDSLGGAVGGVITSIGDIFGLDTSTVIMICVLSLIGVLMVYARKHSVQDPQQGYSQGYSQGYQQDHQQGYQQDPQQGYQQGYSQDYPQYTDPNMPYASSPMMPQVSY